VKSSSIREGGGPVSPNLPLQQTMVAMPALREFKPLGLANAAVISRQTG
jgi:hypothetical protein